MGLRPRGCGPSRKWNRARARWPRAWPGGRGLSMLPTKVLSFLARSLTLGAVNVTTNAHGDHQKFHRRRVMRRRRAGNYFLILLIGFLTACKEPGPRALLDGDRLMREG